MSKSDNMPTKGGIELVVYQMGELKNDLTALSGKIDGWKDALDKRVSALELWQAAEVASDKAKQERESSNTTSVLSPDTGKIIWAALSIATTALALLGGQQVVR